MPTKPKHPCARAGCPALVRHGRYCPDHRTTRQPIKDNRINGRKLYGWRWQKARAAYLKRNPLCCQHQADGQVVPAVAVDHRIPHGGDMVLFWDENNWQPLCTECHNRKSAKELAAQRVNDQAK